MAIDLINERLLFKLNEDKQPPMIRIINAPPRQYWSTRLAEPEAARDCQVCDPVRDFPPTREVLHVNARRRIPGEWDVVPLRAPRHRHRRWMTDSYHRRIQKKWDKQAEGKTMKVPQTESVVLSLSRIAVDKIARAMRPRRPVKGRVILDDLTIPNGGKFLPLQVDVNHKDMSVRFITRDQDITAEADDLNAAEWVTLHLKPGGRHA